MQFIVIIVSVLVLLTHNVNAASSFDTRNLANGEYSYSFEDGLYKKDETGRLDSEGNPVVRGQYSYVVGDNEYIVTYSADKDGYHPKVTVKDFKQDRNENFVGYAENAALVASLLG